MRESALTGAAIVASALLLVACTEGSSSPSLPPGAQQVPTGPPSTQTTTSATYPRSTIYSNLTVQHPSAWRLVPAVMMSAGPSSQVAYLTNQGTTAQCSTEGDTAGVYSISCQPPVVALLPNGVFVIFTGYFMLPHAPSSHNRVLDGHAATVQPVSPEAGGCPAGTTGAVQMSIFLPLLTAIPAGSGQTVTMAACYAGPDITPIIHDIDALIDSVQFT
jgi:hypothetical protein